MKKPKSSTRPIRFGPDLAAAIDEFCKLTGRTFSDVVRTGAAKEIGKKSLAKIRGRGKPKKAD